jgi:hypothetical protein
VFCSCWSPLMDVTEFLFAVIFLLGNLKSIQKGNLAIQIDNLAIPHFGLVINLLSS